MRTPVIGLSRVVNVILPVISQIGKSKLTTSGSSFSSFSRESGVNGTGDSMVLVDLRSTDL